MSQANSDKDYYGVLGVDERASRVEINRQYKRQASKHHPDLGGSEEEMKSLNEAYTVLKDRTTRREYDATRKHPTAASGVARGTTPTARDVGVFGHCLSALLCLITGMFLLFLVRFQWIWFLWPLAILAVFVIGFGVLMARSAMVAVNASLSMTNPLKRHTGLQEIAFWAVILTGGYGVYVVMTL